MNNILLTGSSGFIGTYFIHKYKSKYNIKQFSFLKDDIAMLDLEKIDVIIHLSALVHQMGGASASEYERVNVEQTLALAKRAKESGVRHFIFMSSVKVYGEESDTPYTERTPCLPEDEYGKSKLKAEKELQRLEDEEFRVSIIRTPIVYGFGVKANIQSLINLVAKVPILPFGDIQNRRSMVYIGNLSHMIDVIIQKREKGIFLATDDATLSTQEFIKLIAKVLGKEIYLIKLPLFQRLLKSLKPSFHKRLYGSLMIDATQTKEILFENKALPYSVEQGIELMIHGES
jgi:UDP-glucose 4-epimerase